MTTASPKRRWAGETSRTFNTEVAAFYWETDIPVKEICEAFGISPQRHVLAQAGPAKLLGRKCVSCGDDALVYSRTEADEILNKRRCRGSGYYCHKCKRKHITDREKAFFEAMDARRARIEELRRMPYREYLQTQEWIDTRERMKKIANYRCQVCAKSGPIHVHHRTYVRRGEEYNRDLIVLCADCHSLFHEHGSLAEGGRADKSSSRYEEVSP